MHYEGRFYKSYEELQQDIVFRNNQMLECLKEGRIDDLVRCHAENLRFLKHMKKNDVRSEAIMLLHSNTSPLIAELQTSLLNFQALIQNYYAKEAISRVIKKHEFANVLLEYMLHCPPGTAFKMKKARYYLGKAECLEAVMTLRSVGVIYYNAKKGEICLTDYGRHILEIVL